MSRRSREDTDTDSACKLGRDCAVEIEPVGDVIHKLKRSGIGDVRFCCLATVDVAKYAASILNTKKDEEIIPYH